MMGCPLWELRVTHEPSGICVTVTSNQFRMQHKAREAAMKLLRSRLYMHYNTPQENNGVTGIAPIQKSKYVYDLPDDEPFPNELSDYKVEFDEH